MREAQFGGTDLQRAFAAWDADVENAARDLQELGHAVDALQRKLSNLKFDEGLARIKFEEALRESSNEA